LVRQPFTIEYTPEAVDHLDGLDAGQRSRVVDEIDAQLRHQPTVVTRNRKLLRANPVAPWELRVEQLRVYFDVETQARIVTVRAVGVKIRERVVIGGQQVDLG
jgi:mRNA-degrading endonuclease RelE of RelBE toxin-antitoxin system